MLDLTERLKQLKEDKEDKQGRLVDYYYSSLDLFEISLEEFEEMYRKHNNNLLSLIKVNLGLGYSKRYLAKRQALEEAIARKKELERAINKF